MRQSTLRASDGIRHARESFNWPAIKAELAGEEPQEDEHNPGEWVKRLWLGTVMALAPSGKMYAPFACSNLDACPDCHGTGATRPHGRTGKRIRRKLAKLARDYGRRWARETDHLAGISGRCFLQAQRDPRPLRYFERSQRYKAMSERKPLEKSCERCDGTGSNEAAADERFWEEMDRCADEIDAFISCDDGETFIIMNADPPEGEDDSDDSEDETPRCREHLTFDEECHECRRLNPGRVTDSEGSA